MPLTTDEATLSVSQDLVKALRTIAGPHPGYRPAHAHGTLLTGTFTPSATASTLSSAPHFSSSSTFLTARLSSSTGLPDLPDTDPNGNPRGLALRFHYDSSNPHKHTDIVAHSTPYFPVNNGADFLAFFQALIASPAGTPSPSPIEKFLGSHPAALAFVQAPKPTPASLASEAFYSVSALVLVSGEGKRTSVRYRIVPVSGEKHLSEEEVKEKAPDFLFAALPGQLPIEYKLLAQVAEDGDVTDDATVRWSEDREIVELGTIILDSVVEGEAENKEEQRKIIFDPVPRIQGIEASGDLLFDVRATVYLISGRERRDAKGHKAEGGEGMDVAKEAPH